MRVGADAEKCRVTKAHLSCVPRQYHQANARDGINEQQAEFGEVIVLSLKIFGIPLAEAWQQYYLDLVLTLAVIWGASNLFRTPIGRSFVAVRDSELSARCLGVNVEWVKIQAFGVCQKFSGSGTQDR